MIEVQLTFELILQRTCKITHTVKLFDCNFELFLSLSGQLPYGQLPTRATGQLTTGENLLRSVVVCKCLL